jgi:N-acetylglucosamine kinase-like BadF-type ATPase
VDVTRRVLAIDGGGSKTDVVLIDTRGEVIAQVQGPASQPQNIGIPAALAVLDELVAQVRQQAGLHAGLPAGRQDRPATDEPLADHAAVYLSGMDLPQEIAAIEPFLRERRWAGRLVIDNDTFAVLRAGTQTVDAVAVVCGTGINCVGRNAAGNQARFAALGELTGDWGGGHHLGTQALWHAARADDGRGPATALQQAVAGHFDRPDAISVGIAVHFAEISHDRLNELAPVVFAVAATGDPVAGRLVDQLAAEIAGMATVAMRRLDLLDRPVDLVLGGGVARGRDPRLLHSLGRLVLAANPRVEITVVDAAPVVGAALLGLDALGVPAGIGDRVREALSA